MISLIMDLKIKKIGGSNYFLVPSEFIKVFSLKDFNYTLEVSRDGKSLLYKRDSKDE